LSRKDFIFFHSFSRILLLIWKYPSTDIFPYEYALPVLKILHYLQSNYIANATETFYRYLRTVCDISNLSWNKREVVYCLLIPCCFLLGISNSGDTLLKNTIIDRLDFIPTQARLRFKTHPCSPFIDKSSRFSKQLLKIFLGPDRKLQQYTKNVPCVNAARYISEGGKKFLNLYMSEVLVDYCMYHKDNANAKVYQNYCDSALKLMHGLIVKHISTKKQNTPGSSNWQEYRLCVLYIFCAWNFKVLFHSLWSAENNFVCNVKTEMYFLMKGEQTTNAAVRLINGILRFQMKNLKMQN